MKYQVIWQSVAEEELAGVWLAAADRDAVAAAAEWLDARLARSPLTLGESRDSSVHRIAIQEPIGIEFEVVEDDKRVIVQGVFGLD
jgi:hypothetical protein